MPENQSNSTIPDSGSTRSEQTPGGENTAQKSLEPSFADIEHRRSIPSVIVRQIEQLPRMPGISARDYFDLFFCLVEATEAKCVLDYLSVIDVTASAMEVKFYRRMKPLVLERHREARSEQLADRELDSALPGICRPGVHSEAKRKAKQRSLTSPTDDAQAFLDSIESYKQIEWLVDSAERRQNRALQDIERRRKSFADRLRVVSDAFIEGTSIKKLKNADDVAEKS